MKRLNVLVLAALAGAVPAYAIDVVVPNAFPTTAGGGTFLGQLSNAGRTYQWLIHSDQLTGLVGQDLTGITYRLLPSATAPWPTVDVNYASYDLYLSESVAPANRSLTFASNVVGTQTQVRSGPLTIPAGSFPAGTVVAPNAEDFGMTITFNQPWHYSGGHVLIELRHPGFTGTSASVDGITTTNTTAGYLTQFSACHSTSGPLATSGTQSNFAIIRLSTGVLPCYANCDASTVSPVLNVADFSCFLQKYAAGDVYANCDGSVTPPTLNVGDFSCFLAKYAAGCP